MAKKRKKTLLYYVCSTLKLPVKWAKQIIKNLILLSKYLFRCKDSNNIRKLKNKYKGERCFIVCTGPSLTVNDLELIKDEYSFSMNSIVGLFDKTSYRPTFYFMQDCYVYSQIEEMLSEHIDELDKIFIGQYLDKIYKLKNEKTIVYYDDGFYQGKGCGIRKVKFSNNPAIKVYDSRSVTFSCIQFAAYMGFKEIYLIGSDCNYNKDVNHVIEYKIQQDLDLDRNQMALVQIRAHKYIQNKIKKIKVYNATRGGMLEEYPRVNLEDVIKENAKHD